MPRILIRRNTIGYLTRKKFAMQKKLRFTLLILFGLFISMPAYQQNNNIDEAYNKEIALADEAFEAEEYQKAQKHYKKALKIKPNAKYPRYRLEDSITLEEMKRQQEAKKDKEKLEDREDAYKNAIIRGVQNFKKEQYNIAKDAYLEALTIKHWEQYPKNQIKKINQILFLSELERKYRYTVDMADMFFDAEQYYKSRDKYNEALEIKPKEEYPKKQLQRITNILEYQKRLKDYNKIIAKADKNYYAKQYKQAKTQYREALTIFDKQYPKEQIKKINDILSEFNQVYGYEIAIEKADKLFKQQKYLDAKKSYHDALNIKPGEPYPKSQINKIETILAQQNKLAKYNRIIKEADQFFEDKMLTKAKLKYKEALEVLPGKQYPQDQLEKIENLLDLQNVEIVYNSIIWKADSLFKIKKYIASKNKYEDALEVIPGKEYPKNQVKKIDSLLLSQNKINQYNAKIKVADNFVSNKKYNSAKQMYQEALSILPGKQYPRDQINKINDILALQNKQQQYNNLIRQADEKLETKLYLHAKELYSQALDIYPNKTYPKEQIEKINQLLAEQEKQKQYSQLVKKGDDDFKIKQYSNAKIHYQNSLEILPQKKYPKEQISKINRILTGQQEQEKYNALIKEADLYFQQESYRRALAFYKKALSIFPGKKYPKSQIDLIENMIDREKKYNETIAKADKFFNNKQYQYALIAYNDALNLFNREYPQRQMAKINEILNKQKPVKEEINSKIPKVEYEEFDLDLSTADSMKIEEYYKKAINKGDNALEAKYFSAARFYFSKAHELKPNEPYPQTQLEKIEKEINSIMNNLGNKSYQDLINRADRAFKDGYYSIAEYYYLFALSVKPNEEYPRKKLKEIKDMIPTKEDQ